MATERERGRSRERFERLGKSSLDREPLQREAIDDLRRVIGFDRWCWPLADPDTLLPLAGIADHDYGPSLPWALELEFSGKDFVAKHLVAREANGAGSLSAETGGDLARSPRWDEVMRIQGRRRPCLRRGRSRAPRKRGRESWLSAPAHGRGRKRRSRKVAAHRRDRPQLEPRGRPLDGRRSGVDRPASGRGPLRGLGDAAGPPPIPSRRSRDRRTLRRTRTRSSWASTEAG